MNPLIEQIRKAKKNRSSKLTLDGLFSFELPDELFELTWLKELILDGDELDYLDGSLDFRQMSSRHLYKIKLLYKNYPKMAIFNKKLNNLQKLDKLESLGLYNLPIIDYSFLENLNINFLRFNKFNSNELKKSIIKIKNLRELDISASKNNEVGFISELENLTHLNISSSKINNLEFARNLNNLKFLDISHTEIISLEPIFNRLDKIKIAYEGCNRLNLDYFKFKNIEEIAVLNKRNIDFIITENTSSKRIILDLSANELKEIPLVVFEMEWIEYLDLSHNFIEVISDKIEKLVNLKYLNIKNNPLKIIDPAVIYLPKMIQFIKEYEPINVQKNEAVKAQQYEKAADLRVHELKFLEKNGISCDIENLQSPPYEIAKSGIISIFEYLRQVKEQGGTTELYEAKLIIVGEGATGKTTLYKKLINEDHQVGNTSETHGINIFEGLPFQHTQIADHTFYSNLWDFGGQELQYMTHQFFLTPRAFYVLMMDARKESPNLAYWFKIISLLGYEDIGDSSEKVKLLLVFNIRKNSTGGYPQYQDILKYYEDRIDAQFLEVDFSENDFRFKNLIETIRQNLVTLPIVKSKLPLAWKVVRDALRDEAKSEAWIPISRYASICQKYGIDKEKDQWQLSNYLHQLGSLLHFQNDEVLIDTIILQPHWAVKGVYTLLKNKKIADENFGRFSKTDIFEILENEGYTRIDVQKILLLMSRNNFDICYQAENGDFVAAQLLPDNSPEFNWHPSEVLKFQFQYPIMPKGMISRLIVRLSQFIETDLHSRQQNVWKKGVVLYFKLPEGECRVRIIEDNAESSAGLRQILIEVAGDKDARKYALRKVRNEVDDLHQKWFRSIEVVEMVPCCCDKCRISDQPKLYPLSDLLELKQESTMKQCTTGKMISIQTLLEGIYESYEIKGMDHSKGF